MVDGHIFDVSTGESVTDGEEGSEAEGAAITVSSASMRVITSSKLGWLWSPLGVSLDGFVLGTVLFGIAATIFSTVCSRLLKSVT